MTQDFETDYIVVGAGSAGCVMAARLTEDPATQVTVLEAGGADRSPWIHIPIGYGKTIVDPRLNWRFETEPDAEIGGRRMYWARGKVLGGSSSINGLLYIRGQAEDYDLWRQMGNTGWGYESVLPYFRKAEDQENGSDTYHGADGPLRVSNLVERNPLCDAFIKAGVRTGIPETQDFNGASQEGIGYYQLTTRHARRCSAAVAYLHPARKRPNLRVETGAMTRRVIFEGRRAIGVEAEINGRTVTIRARREVILAAGSINSPKLLLLSGVGPAGHLADMGLPVVHDLPGVGENLQDHYGAIMSYKARRPLTVNDIMANPLRQLQVGLQYILTRKGPLTISAAQVGAFIKSSPDVATPDLQFLFQTFSGGYYEDGLFKFSGFANFICPVRPRSRGHMTLRSADPHDMPRLFPNYFSDPTDRRIAVEGLKLARRMAGTGPLADFVIDEHLPGSDKASDAEIEQYLCETGGCVSHQVGTCKMGQDANAVVDDRLRVRGVTGLRVIDASIMPRLISGNTNAATIMIGEKGADMVRSDAA